MTVASAVSIPAGYEGYMDWARIGMFLLFTTMAISSWSVTWWWHWLGRERSIKVGRILSFFRRGR